MRAIDEPPVDQTPAEILRLAATQVREMAAKASRGPWVVADCETYPRWILSDGEAENGYRGTVAELDESAVDFFSVSDANWEWMAFASPALAEPLAAWFEATARTIDDDVMEVVPDCCGEVHTEPGLIHTGGCTWWLTTYRGHSAACTCFDEALAMARAILGRPS